MVYSLNHNIMESFQLDSNQELPKSDPALAASQCNGALICPTYLIEREKTFYICLMWMWEGIKGELQAQP
jgi:hypothetical protein